MSAITQTIGIFFGWILNWCFKLTNDFGSAIWVFTFLTKIILLPVSIVVQLNSIKMVKMYPEMNRFKAKYFGDNDMISEAQYELYKKHNYHPILDLLPVIIQLVLLMGVVEGIYSLMRQGVDMSGFGLDLSLVPIKNGGLVLLIPLFAALSALLMCITQNISNVLQSEQGMANKAITLSISVGLSLYLGLFVPAGIGMYWIAGNIFSILQMYALNFFINPKKHIDYEDLEASKKELKKLVEDANNSKKNRTKEEIEREKSDYKRFMKAGYKQLVFYSESNGFYKYFKDVIEYILKKTDIDIHYICSDPNDAVFKLASEQFHPYYIGENKLIVLMMKLEADICVMTTPDLQTYHLKKSLVQNNIEYIYMDHAMGDVNLTYRKHALDNFDTIFIPNEYTEKEIRAQEELYKLNKKNLVNYGYALIDNMIKVYNESHPDGSVENEKPCILIAPSWQKDNLIDLCVDDILKGILGKGYEVILRPHPQYVRHYKDRLLAIKERYSQCSDFDLQMDFSSNSTVYDADVLMTDWSGIAYEYAFTTLKPVLFIDTPMKIMNEDYKEIGIEPIDVILRDKIGISVKPENLAGIGEAVEKLLHDDAFGKESMAAMRDVYLYNVGRSAEAGAKYIINRIIERSK